MAKLPLETKISSESKSLHSPKSCLSSLPEPSNAISPLRPIKRGLKQMLDNSIQSSKKINLQTPTTEPNIISGIILFAKQMFQNVTNSITTDTDTNSSIIEPSSGLPTQSQDNVHLNQSPIISSSLAINSKESVQSQAHAYYDVRFNPSESTVSRFAQLPQNNAFRTYPTSANDRLARLRRSLAENQKKESTVRTQPLQPILFESLDQTMLTDDEDTNSSKFTDDSDDGM